MSDKKTLLESLVEERVRSADRHFYQRQGQLAIQIEKVLDEKGMTQRDLAHLASKKESYISRLMAGGANPTMKTICELEAALNADLQITPQKHEDQKKHQLVTSARKTVNLDVQASNLDVSDGRNWMWHKSRTKVAESSSESEINSAKITSAENA